MKLKTKILERFDEECKRIFLSFYDTRAGKVEEQQWDRIKSFISQAIDEVVEERIKELEKIQVFIAERMEDKDPDIRDVYLFVSGITQNFRKELKKTK